MMLSVSRIIRFIFFKFTFRSYYKKVINGIPINLRVKNKYSFFRALYYYEKDTLDWIDKFNEKDIFWDVGSCTGVYSIYASLKKNCIVFAFEPLILNFYLTYENLKLNNVIDHCSVFNLFLGAKNHLDDIFIEKNLIGVSQQLNLKNENFLKQSVLKYSIDYLVENLGFQVPNHIKIDVERAELDLINGCRKTISNKNLKSIAIECHKDFSKKINEILTENNFELDKKVKQSETDTIFYYIRNN